MFVNDFSHSIPAVSILFADDTTLLIPGSNYLELIHLFNFCRPYLESWLQLNKLYLNIEKTFYLIFGTASSDIFKLQLLNTEITRCFSATLLGLTLDSKYNWKEHIQKLLMKLLPLKPIFYHIRDKLTTQSKFLLYYSLVQSRLNYCIEFYGSTTKSNLKSILVTQNRLIKILFKLQPRHSTAHIYNFLHISPFYDLYYNRLFIIAHKAIHTNICHFPTQLLNLSPLSRHKYYCILHHSKLYHKDILHNIFIYWNSTADNIRETSNINISLKQLQLSRIELL